MDSTNGSSLRLDLLLSSVRGLREWRALALLLLGGLLWALLIAGLGALTRSRVGAVIGLIVGALFWFAAYLGAGRIFMARARGDASHYRMLAALKEGIGLLPRGIGVVLMLIAAGVAVGIVEALVFLLCKIPYLGPVLYFFLQPAGIVVAAVTGFALWVMSLLAMPAVWDGRGAVEAIRTAWTSLRRDPGEVGFLLLALLVLVGMVSTVITGILLAGAFFSMGIGAGVTAGAGGYAAAYPGAYSAFPGLATLGVGPSYLPGMLFGWIVTWILISLLPAGMLLQGQALIYASLSKPEPLAAPQTSHAGGTPAAGS